MEDQGREIVRIGQLQLDRRDRQRRRSTRPVEIARGDATSRSRARGGCGRLRVQFQSASAFVTRPALPA